MELPKCGDLLLGKYLLEEPIGEGGMGIVYAARHELLGQRVAVKLIRPEFVGHGMSVARFVNEARAAARIESDHVARVLDAGMLDGSLPYMVLEYLDGIDLAALSNGNSLPTPDVVDYLLQAIEGLAQAHSLGIVHRDLKPSNLYLARRPDGTARVKILDFGISKASTSIPAAGDMTKTNDLLGTPLYMSPEQLRNSKGVDHRSDIWALGVVAYELLTGAPPFTAENAVALFATIQESDPPSLRERRSDIPAELDAIVQRCVQRRAQDRFESVTELAAALAPFATAVGVRSYENAARILPPTSSPAPRDTLSSVPSGREVSSPRIDLSSVAATTPLFRTGQTHTGDPWATSNSRPRMPSSRRRTAAMAAAFGLLVVAAAIVVPRAWQRRVRADVSSSVAGPPVPSDTPAASAASATVPAASTSETAATAATAASVAPAAKPPSEEARPGRPAAGGTEGARVQRPKPPSTGASSHAPRSCKPPYTIDANGDQHWKPECL